MIIIEETEVEVVIVVRMVKSTTILRMIIIEEMIIIEDTEVEVVTVVRTVKSTTILVITMVAIVLAPIPAIILIARASILQTL